MSVQNVVGVILLAALAYYLWPRREVWTGIAYPSASNLLEHQVVGEFDSLDVCLDAVITRVNTFKNPNSADYECGLNCRVSEVDSDLMICEETKDWK